MTLWIVCSSFSAQAWHRDKSHSSMSRTSTAVRSSRSVLAVPGTGQVLSGRWSEGT